MSEYLYNFTEFTSLGGASLEASWLTEDVEDDPAIVKACLGVTVDDGAETVTFLFGEDLLPAEETALDALVVAYDGETLAQAKARCVADCKTHLAHHLRCGCCTGDLSTALDDCDAAIAAVMTAADVAAAEAARDAYTGA